MWVRSLYKSVEEVCHTSMSKGYLLLRTELEGGNRVNQPWIFIGRTDAEAEAPALWPPDAKSWLIGKTLMLGKIEGRRRRGWQGMKWLDGIINSVDMSLRKLQEKVKDSEAWHTAVHGVTKNWTWLSNWTTKIKGKSRTMSYRFLFIIFT